MSSTKTLDQFNTIADEINSLYHRAAGKMGFSDSEFMILYMLYSYGETITQSDIIAISGMSKQTINSAVTKMEDKGWLTRAERSGRKRSINLTETGRKILNEVIGPFQELEETIFDNWTDEERQQFIELNIRYRDAMKSIVDKMPDKEDRYVK